MGKKERKRADNRRPVGTTPNQELQRGNTGGEVWITTLMTQPWILWFRERGLLTVLLLTAAVRFVHLLFISANDPFFSMAAPGTDMETYWNQGKAIAGGDLLLRSFSGAFYYGPLYSYFLAPWIWLFGENLSLIHYVQFLLGLVLSALAWYLGRRLAGPDAGLVAGLLAGLCVPVIYWNQTVLVEGLNLTLVAGALVLMVLASDREHRILGMDRKGYLQWALAGALLGLAVSGRGNTLLVILGMVVVRAWVPVRTPSEGNIEPSAQGPSSWKTFVVRRRLSALVAAVFLGGALTTISLPVARNLIVAKRFAITTNGPALLYIGNYRDAIGVLTSSPYLEDLMKKHGGEPPYMKELIQEAKNNPWHILRMQWAKLRIFVSAYDAPDNFSLDLYSRYSPVLGYNPIGWTFLVILGGLGAWHLRHRLGPRGDLWPMTAILVLFPLSLIPILVVGRYRLPWLFPLMVLGGVGGRVLWEAWRRRGTDALWAPVVWAAVAVVITLPRWSPASHAITFQGSSPRYIRPNDWVQLADGMEKAKWDPARSLEVLKQGLNYHPDSPMIAYRVGNILMNSQRSAEAISVMESYLLRQPTDVLAAKMLASAYILERKPKQALDILDQVIKIIPGDQDTLTLQAHARQLLARENTPAPPRR